MVVRRRVDEVADDLARRPVTCRSRRARWPRPAPAAAAPPLPRRVEDRSMYAEVAHVVNCFTSTSVGLSTRHDAPAAHRHQEAAPAAVDVDRSRSRIVRSTNTGSGLRVPNGDVPPTMIAGVLAAPPPARTASPSCGRSGAPAAWSTLRGRRASGRSAARCRSSSITSVLTTACSSTPSSRADTRVPPCSS